jgi:hypothetical protein
MPEFPPAIYLTTRPDLGDVSKGKLVTIDNYQEAGKSRTGPLRSANHRSFDQRSGHRLGQSVPEVESGLHSARTWTRDVRDAVVPANGPAGGALVSAPSGYRCREALADQGASAGARRRGRGTCVPRGASPTGQFFGGLPLMAAQFGDQRDHAGVDAGARGPRAGKPAAQRPVPARSGITRRLNWPASALSSFKYGRLNFRMRRHSLATNEIIEQQQGSQAAARTWSGSGQSGPRARRIERGRRPGGRTVVAATVPVALLVV